MTEPIERDLYEERGALNTLIAHPGFALLRKEFTQELNTLIEKALSTNTARDEREGLVYAIKHAEETFEPGKLAAAMIKDITSKLNKPKD
jgi:hypothetical protein